MDENKEIIELNIDQEFWGDFVQEAFEHLEDIEANVISLEQDPENMEIIHTMFRAYHTIKGLSGFVEHTVIQELAHKTETMMDLCRKQELKVNKDIVDAILKSADYIKRLCEDIDSVKDSDFLSSIDKHNEVLERIANLDTAEPVVEQVEAEPFVITEEVSSVVDENVTTVEIVEEFVETVVEELPVFSEQATETETANVEVELEQPAENLDALLAEDLTCLQIEETNEDVVEEIQAAPVADKPQTLPQEPVQESKNVNVPQQQAPQSKKAPFSNEEHMKVATSKIDHLVEMIGELVINQSLLEQHIAQCYSTDSELISEMGGFLSITRELQYLSMSLRMVSLKPTFQKISRIARDTIQELHKDVEFVTSGEATEIDRVVTDKLLDPLVHLIKNAISHGVEEDKQDRIDKNKPPKARVELNAFNKRGKIFIEIKDDGRGIDTEVVYAKALEKGLIDPSQTYTDEEIKEFILLPGFSTAKQIDNISGRGVGMDVVKTQIIKIGGKVDIKSELGVGSTFTLEVPVNHAIMNGTVIEIQDQQFIVPTMNVKEILLPLESQWVSTQGHRTMLKVRENIIPIVPQSLLFRDYTQIDNAKLVMLLELDQELRALPIANVVNRQEVVVKPVGPEFANLKYISGMSILGNGRVSLILDIDYLFKKEVQE